MAMNFGKLDFAVSFNRQTAFPLDAKSYFESLTSAQAAAATAQEAGSSETTYYYGQQVAVVESGVATLYVIQPDKTLKEVGGKVAINEDVFVKDEEGKLNLLGFADAVAGAQLVKSADGKVSWVKPDTTTVEGLSTAVEALQTDVKNLTTRVSANETAIGKKTEGDVAGTGILGDLEKVKSSISDVKTEIGEKALGENPATGIYKEIADANEKIAQNATDISGKADKATTLAGYGITDGMTATEIASAIAKAVSESGHAEFVKVDSVPSAEEAESNKLYLVYNETTKHYDIYAKVGDSVEQLDDTTVDLSNYYQKSEVDTKLEGKVSVEEGKGLSSNDFTAELLEKLNGIEDGANKVDFVSAEPGNFKVENKVLKLGDAVSDALVSIDDKVAKEDGKSLVSDTLIEKLTSLPADAQANYIKSVDSQFSVSDAGELSLNAIAQSKITGLDTALAGKVNVEEGKDLSTNDFTDELLKKLTDIKTADIQANILEVVKVNGEALPIAEKTVDIPIASATALGVVKGSVEENEIAVGDDGIMSVNSVNVQKLVQTEGEQLILNCGDASGV